MISVFLFEIVNILYNDCLWRVDDTNCLNYTYDLKVKGKRQNSTVLRSLLCILILILQDFISFCLQFHTVMLSVNESE